jgi:hypothetical protein
MASVAICVLDVKSQSREPLINKPITLRTTQNLVTKQWKCIVMVKYLDYNGTHQT